MFSNTLFPLFDSFSRPSIYVISDSQLAQFKRNQAEAEVIELDKLIEGHEASIKRLKTTREQLRADYPVLQPKEEHPNLDESNTSSV